MNVNVLVVDDDSAVRALLVHMLKGMDVGEIVEAADGDEAVARFDESAFDLVLLDWEMPRRSGLDVTNVIHQKNDQTQIIMISAEAQREQVLQAVQAGAAGYILKPFEPGPVRQKLQSLCHALDLRRKTADYRIRHVMTSKVVTVRQDTTVRRAIETLLEHRISGLPVVDAEDRLVGLITEYQLVQALFRPDVSDEPVGRFMTTELVTVGEDALLFQVANLLVKHRMRRIPVVRDGRVVGIIARRDLLRYMLEHEDELATFLNSLKTSREPVTAAVE